MQIGIRADMDEALIVRIARLFQLISGLGARRSRHHVDDAIIIVAEVAQKGRQHGRGLRFGVVETGWGRPEVIGARPKRRFLTRPKRWPAPNNNTFDTGFSPIKALALAAKMPSLGVFVLTCGDVSLGGTRREARRAASGSARRRLGSVCGLEGVLEATGQRFAEVEAQRAAAG